MTAREGGAPGATPADRYAPRPCRLAAISFVFVAGGLGRYRDGVGLATLGRRELEQQGFSVQAIDRRLLEELDADARRALGDAGYEVAARVGEGVGVHPEDGVVLTLDLTVVT